MGTWGLIQIVIDIFLGLGLFLMAIRLGRPAKDDPRLSRGLQLLQSKISVLEDLSDRTEVQVNQLAALLDQKCREVQNKITAADRSVQLIRASMDKSMEVARIFQDRIPHTEIIERQNTVKYVQAARLAHHGMPVEEIAKKIDLPKGELEFIAKVNRDRLMFSEADLPEWAKGEQAGDLSALVPEEYAQPPIHAAVAPQDPPEPALIQSLKQVQFEMNSFEVQEGAGRDFSQAFETPVAPNDSLSKLGEEFRKACELAGNKFDEQKRQEAAEAASAGMAQAQPAAASLPVETTRAATGLVPIQQLKAFVQQAFNDNVAPILDSVTAAATEVMEGSSAPVETSTGHQSGETTTAATEGEKLAAQPLAQSQEAPAAQARLPKPTAAPAGTGVDISRSVTVGKKPEPEIRKVEFPRIDIRDNLS